MKVVMHKIECRVFAGMDCDCDVTKTECHLTIPAAPAPDLAPCPFCGETKIKKSSASGGHGMSIGFMSCSKCSAQGPDDYSGPIAASWNRQAPIPPAPAPGLRELADRVVLACYEAKTNQIPWDDVEALQDMLADLPHVAAKAAIPIHDPGDMHREVAKPIHEVSPSDVALMDELIADISHNGGQESPERDDWAETYKAGWTRIKSALVPPGAPTQTTKEPK